MEHQGWISLVPTVIVLLVALWSKKTFEALVVGSLTGFVLVGGYGFFNSFTDSLLRVMQDPTIGWIILVCGLFGSLIHLLISSGGAQQFAQVLLRLVKSRRGALLMTWLLGLCIFIDDYLNALTVGASMKKLTDKYKVPREMLAYVVDSTAAPICVLIPLSTWAIYVGGLLESEEVAAVGQGLSFYIKAIPFMLYGWVAAIIVPLVIVKILPAMGRMKTAEERVATGGSLAPANSNNIALKEVEVKSNRSKISYFIVPILVLIGATIAFQIDALKGVITAVLVTILWFSIGKIMPFKTIMADVFDGFKTMLYALAIIVMSFVLKDINDQLGLTNYIIELVSPWMQKAYLPVLAFLSLSLITFSTGSFWGVYAIAFPIIIPLAQSVGANVLLTIGAVVSAGAFGSHACFYGDATVLSASATGCNNMAHALSQLPYALIAGAISALGFILLGLSS